MHYYDPSQQFLLSAKVIIKLVYNPCTIFSKVIEIIFFYFDFVFTAYDKRHRFYFLFLKWHVLRKTAWFFWSKTSFRIPSLSFWNVPTVVKRELLIQYLYPDSELKYFVLSNIPGFWCELQDNLQNQSLHLCKKTVSRWLFDSIWYTFACVWKTSIIQIFPKNPAFVWLIWIMLKKCFVSHKI